MCPQVLGRRAFWYASVAAAAPAPFRDSLNLNPTHHLRKYRKRCYLSVVGLASRRGRTKNRRSLFGGLPVVGVPRRNVKRVQLEFHFGTSSFKHMPVGLSQPHRYKRVASAANVFESKTALRIAIITTTLSPERRPRVARAPSDAQKKSSNL